MTRTFRAGQLSQLVTLFWQQLSIYCCITAEASASLALPSMNWVRPAVKLWGHILLLAAGQGSPEEANTALGNSLNPPRVTFQLPLSQLGSRFLSQAGTLQKPMKPWAWPPPGGAEGGKRESFYVITAQLCWVPARSKGAGAGRKGKAAVVVRGVLVM